MKTGIKFLSQTATAYGIEEKLLCHSGANRLLPAYTGLKQNFFRNGKILTKRKPTWTHTQERKDGRRIVMREILFRGQRQDNREWVHGDLEHLSYGVITIQGYIVDPETVGEYTGIEDGNGAKIFEGDVVKTTTKITTGRAETVVRVFFSELCASFMLAGGILCGPEFMHKNRKYAVISNIHDTPKLLSGGNG
jgi:hypothetical protein